MSEARSIEGAPSSTGAPFVCIVDSKLILFRHHHASASNPKLNQRNENVSALQGLANTLAALQARGPCAIVCAMDARGPTHRHRLYPGYKGDRKPTPPEMTAQLAVAPDLAKSLGALWLELPGYEADDLIASLAFRAELSGLRAEIVTSDKDLSQMVSPGCSVLKPALGGTFEEMGPAEVSARWGGVAPWRLRHVLALMGDSVDCIPGVKGIGEKQAIDLVRRFGSVGGVYAALEAGLVTGRQASALEAGKADAALSLELVTLRFDAPMLPWSALAPLCKPDPARLEVMARRYQLWLPKPDGASLTSEPQPTEAP